MRYVDRASADVRSKRSQLCYSHLFAIVGPTASGKTQLALALAQKFGGDILICDAFQIRQGLPILTAKPSLEEQHLVPHHLLGILPLSEAATAARFVSLADAVIAQMIEQHKPLWICGGTGLYLKALVEGLFPGPGASPPIRAQLKEDARILGISALHQRLSQVDPVAAAKIAPTDYVRIERALEVFLSTGRPISLWHQESKALPQRYQIRYIGLDPGQEALRERIFQRTQVMISSGVREEVEEVDRMHGNLHHPPMGYELIKRHLRGELSLVGMQELLYRQTAQYARRQRIWFRRLPQVTWYPDPKTAFSEIKNPSS